MSLTNILSKATTSDLMFNADTNTSDGWKISIQGKCVEDAVFLFNALDSFLRSNGIPFKVATKKRLSSSNIEQSRKAMTIYCPNNLDVSLLSEDVYNLIVSYKGWYDVKTPTSYSHYAGGLFIRNDRVNGQYIPAKLC